MKYRIVYQKENGDIIERDRITLPPQAIGEFTSMGWKLIDIKYNYHDRYYSIQTEYLEYKEAKRKFREEIKWA